ncbi:MAG: ATP-binding cassette domain-containing protein [Firmicutes bacterium]|nr:ATP-binding cassette domain-containing protein [Bacillota bacterium]
MSYLEIKNLTYKYEDGTVALDNVSMSVEKGEFIGLLASNGGGKTTLLKTIVGLLKPGKGAITIDKVPLARMSRAEISTKVGLVFQNPSDQLFAPTLEEDVAFGPRNLGLSNHEVKQRVQEAIEMVGLEGCAKKVVHHLSFGQQKKACIAGVLAMKPDIILLDEPTAGLDPSSESNLLSVLGRLNKEIGVTVIIATHMVDLMPLFVDRIYVLREGRMAIEGTPEAVFSSTQMMQEVDLRLPYITHLIEELRQKDQLPFDSLPLTIKDARSKLVSMIMKNNINIYGN